MLERFSSIRSCFIKIKNSWGMHPSPLKSSLGKSKTKLEMLAKLEIWFTTSYINLVVWFLITLNPF